MAPYSKASMWDGDLEQEDYVQDVNLKEAQDRAHRKGFGSRFDGAICQRPRLFVIVLVFSIICNIYLFLLMQRSPNNSLRPEDAIIGLTRRPKVTRKESFWSPEYDVGIAGEEAVDKLWQNYTTGYGVVALDREWALKKGLAPSRSWKLDRSHNVYILAVYHAVHCLHFLRSSYKSMARGEPVTAYWREHGDHCSEVIREELMCSATDEIYASRLDSDGQQTIRSGEGEYRQCADWEYLNHWVGQHTAGWTYEEATGENPRFHDNTPTTDGWYIGPAMGE